MTTVNKEFIRISHTIHAANREGNPHVISYTTMQHNHRLEYEKMMFSVHTHRVLHTTNVQRHSVSKLTLSFGIKIEQFLSY